MVLRYWSRIFVDQDGEVRSIEPFRGKARSILSQNQGMNRRILTMYHLHGIYSGSTESAHARVVIQARVDTVNADGIDTQVLQKRQVTGASSAVGEGVYEARRLLECVVITRNDST